MRTEMPGSRPYRGYPTRKLGASSLVFQICCASNLQDLCLTGLRRFEIGCKDLEIARAKKTSAVHAQLSTVALGTPLSLTLRVATQICGSVFSELRCNGRIVHRRALMSGRADIVLRLSCLSHRPATKS